MEQETLIYIDDKEKYDASVAANFYVNKETKNRAYINTLGAELALKYLQSENIDISNIKNIHSIKKILEDFDLSDIMLPNIHIDVRVIFDEQAIFIPKSHFEYNLVPDIYVVFQLASDFSHVKFLGFFEPKLVNKNNANKDYYFIEKEKLNSPLDLVKYINSFSGNTNTVSVSDESAIISMIDHDLSENDKKQLLEQLTKSADLRDKFLEYENFEMLSSKAMLDNTVEKPEFDVENFENMENSDDTSDFLTEAALGGLAAAGTVAAVNAAETIELPSQISADMVNARMGSESLPEEDLSDLTGTTEETVEENSLGLESIEDTHTDDLNEDNTDLVNVEDAVDFKEETIDVDSIDSGDINVEELPVETVALDSIEPLESVENIENIDNPMDETVSLENFEEKSELGTVIEDNNADFVSLDSAETLDSIENQELPLSDEVASLESFAPVDDAIQEPKQDLDEVASLDNFAPIEDSAVQESAQDLDEVASLDNFAPIEDSSVQEPAQDLDEVASLDNFAPIEDSAVQESAQDLDEVANLDNFAPIEDSAVQEPAQDLDEVASLEDFALPQEIEPEITEDSLDNIDTNELNASLESQEEEKSATFGNNLLENLAAEDEENISIEPIEEEPVDSNELLSQLENVLINSSAAEPLDEGVSSTESDSVPMSEASQNSDEDSKLNVLFNEDASVPAEDIDQLEEYPEQTYAGAALTREKSSNKNLLVTAVLVAALIGAAAFVFLKPKNNENVEPLPQTEEIDQINDDSTDNVIETNTPNVKQEVPTEVKQQVTELKPTPPQPRKHSSESYMSVSRIVWDVPSDLSYSNGIQTYLKTAGKSIKLSLSADLLLATEYAYTDQVKVNLVMSKDGAIESAKIGTSSGSSQIDNIVLQSVKDTLNAIKPPSGEVKTPSFNLNLIIYF